MDRVTRQQYQNSRERRGNAYSGAVAMVLLGMFVLALVNSEMDADRAKDGRGSQVPALIAGQ